MGWTFLHFAVKCCSHKTIEKIVNMLPRDVAHILTHLPDERNRLPRDLVGLRADGDAVDMDKSRDHVDQAGYYSQKLYYLKSAPYVLVFWNSIERDGAADEKNWVVKYLKRRRFPYNEKENPTREEMLSVIDDVLSRESLSGLIVFAMTHGFKGCLATRPDNGSEYILISEITSRMAGRHQDKPKVGIIAKLASPLVF